MYLASVNIVLRTSLLYTSDAHPNMPSPCFVRVPRHLLSINTCRSAALKLRVGFCRVEGTLSPTWREDISLALLGESYILHVPSNIEWGRVCRGSLRFRMVLCLSRTAFVTSSRWREQHVRSTEAVACTSLSCKVYPSLSNYRRRYVAADEVYLFIRRLTIMERLSSKKSLMLSELQRQLSCILPQHTSPLRKSVLKSKLASCQPITANRFSNCHPHFLLSSHSFAASYMPRYKPLPTAVQIQRNAPPRKKPRIPLSRQTSSTTLTSPLCRCCA